MSYTDWMFAERVMDLRVEEDGLNQNERAEKMGVLPGYFHCGHGSQGMTDADDVLVSLLF